MSDNPEPASASSENEYSDDSINIEKTESSSDGGAKRRSNISKKSNYSDDASSDSYYSNEENQNLKSNSIKISSKRTEIIQKTIQKKTEISNSDESPKYKKQKKAKNLNDKKTDSSQHQSRNHSSPYSSRSNNKYDSDTASYSNPHNNHQSSDENSGDASLTALAKKKTGRLKIQHPKKKKHYQYEMVEETEKYESTDDEPDNLERAVNTRSQLTNDADLKPIQEKSKCCLLI